ncbi:hypothetical protein HUT18_20600 [Streptomyces sp. NA04227]|uniref:hypothetical protein n=1 Tax=Streptomyces sp. NA04227 TaxID=2742136 RepID=UPI00158FEB23|nr:hypothetical protein [Streptomyces sp. NA04227]QKW08413.1 hypothetical protein HUT18_20600 [Streptomyces sp. NA04227]
MSVLNARTAGVAVAATGAAHFVVPGAFEALTVRLFPTDTRTWIRRNGTTELVLGTAVAVPRTRAFGAVGLAAYAGWLAFRAVKQR